MAGLPSRSARRARRLVGEVGPPLHRNVNDLAESGSTAQPAESPAIPQGMTHFLGHQTRRRARHEANCIKASRRDVGGDKIPSGGPKAHRSDQSGERAMNNQPVSERAPSS